MSRSPLIILLFICSIIIGLMIQIIASVEYTVLNPDFYIESMDKHHVYDIPQNYAILKITSANEKPSDLTNKSYINAVNTAFSPELNKQESTRIVNNFLGYIKNDRPDLNLQLNFSNRKELFKNELVKQLDDYGRNDLAAYGIDSSNTSEFADDIVNKLSLPDEVNLAQVLWDNNPTVIKGFEFFRNYYIYTCYFSYILLALVFILLLIIARGTGLKWFGTGMITAGILTVFAVSISNNSLDNLIITSISAQDKLLATIGTNPVLLATIIKNSIINIIERVAIIFSITGIIFWITGLYWNKKSIKKTTFDQYKSV